MRCKNTNSQLYTLVGDNRWQEPPAVDPDLDLRDETQPVPPGQKDKGRKSVNSHAERLKVLDTCPITELRSAPNRAAGNGRAEIRIAWSTAGVDRAPGRFYCAHLSFQRDPFRTGVRIPDPGRSLYLHLSIAFE